MMLRVASDRFSGDAERILNGGVDKGIRRKEDPPR